MRASACKTEWECAQDHTLGTAVHIPGPSQTQTGRKFALMRYCAGKKCRSSFGWGWEGTRRRCCNTASSDSQTRARYFPRSSSGAATLSQRTSPCSTQRGSSQQTCRMVWKRSRYSCPSALCKSGKAFLHPAFLSASPVYCKLLPPNMSVPDLIMCKLRPASGSSLC